MGVKLMQLQSEGHDCTTEIAFWIAESICYMVWMRMKPVKLRLWCFLPRYRWRHAVERAQTSSCQRPQDKRAGRHPTGKTHSLWNPRPMKKVQSALRRGSYGCAADLGLHSASIGSSQHWCKHSSCVKVLIFSPLLQHRGGTAFCLRGHSGF